MKYFCDQCKVHPAKKKQTNKQTNKITNKKQNKKQKLHTLIAAHDCASFTASLLVAVDISQLDVTQSSTWMRLTGIQALLPPQAGYSPSRRYFQLTVRYA